MCKISMTREGPRCEVDFPQGALLLTFHEVGSIYRGQVRVGEMSQKISGGGKSPSHTVYGAVVDVAELGGRVSIQWRTNLPVGKLRDIAFMRESGKLIERFVKASAAPAFKLGVSQFREEGLQAVFTPDALLARKAQDCGRSRPSYAYGTQDPLSLILNT